MPDMQIIDILNSLGYSTAPADWYDLVRLWDSWYRGRVRSFHEYRVFNGLRHVPCTKVTAGLAKTIAESWADMLMNDRVVVTLEGETEQAFFDRVCAAGNFRKMANIYEEYAFALGTAAIVARVTGMEVYGEGRALGLASGIALDFVRADGIFPLNWQNGIVTDCAFATEHQTANERLVYLQIHRLTDSEGYLIENRIFRLRENDLYEIPLDSVPEYASVAPVFHTHSDRPFFVLNSPNIASNLFPELPLGISIYANAIDELKVCDNLFDSLNTEFVLGRKRIMVKPEAVKNVDGDPLFDANDLVFYILPEDSQNGSVIKEIEGNLRIAEHTEGLQTALNILGMKCGFGPNHWKFDAGHITTATQVIAANSEEARTQKKHELVLEKVLVDLARIILRLGNLFLGMHLREDVPISVDFDENVVEDRNAEFDRDLRMLDAGILSKVEFRQKWLNEDAATASKALRELQVEEPT